MSDDLVARLRHAWDERERQLDEDERVARAATPGPWSVHGLRDAQHLEADPVTEYEVWGDPSPSAHGEAFADVASLPISASIDNDGLVDEVFPGNERPNAEHIARHDPARVLAEVQRGRRDLAAKRLMVEECAYGIGKSAPRSALNDFAWTMLRLLAEAEGLSGRADEA